MAAINDMQMSFDFSFDAQEAQNDVELWPSNTGVNTINPDSDNTLIDEIGDGTYYKNRALKKYREQNVAGFAPDATLDERLEALEDTIEHYIQNQYGLALGLSGKDSLVLVSATVNIYQKRKQQGLPLPPCSVFTSDTLVENPIMSKVINNLGKQLVAFAETHDLPIKYYRAVPGLFSGDYLVACLGGKDLFTMAFSKSRKCSDDMKVKAIAAIKNKIARANKQSGYPHTVMLLGKYYSESSARGKSMLERGESHLPIEINGQLSASPMCFWHVSDVMEYLYLASKWDALPSVEEQAKMIGKPIPIFADPNELKDAYLEMSGDCFLSASEGTTSSQPCSARSGCHVCTSVASDKSLERLIEKDHPYLAPLNKIRNYIKAKHNDPACRSWISRKFKYNSEDDSYSVTLSPNSYSADFMLEIIGFYLSAQFNEADEALSLGIENRFTVLSMEQILAIAISWDRYGLDGWRVVSKFYELLNDKHARTEAPIVEETFDTIKPAKILKAAGIEATHTLHKDFAANIESIFGGARSGIEALVDVEELNEVAQNDGRFAGEPISLRALQTSESGSISFDFSEAYFLDQILSEKAFEYLNNGRVTGGTVFHFLTRIGVLSFHNSGAQLSYEKMFRVSNCFRPIHHANKSNDPIAVSNFLTTGAD